MFISDWRKRLMAAIRKRNSGVPVKMLRNPIHLLSLGFGAGLSPFAPGTAGTLVAIPLYLYLLHFTAGQYVLIVCILCVVGFGICGVTTRALGVQDHSAIVWDEVVGFLITMTAAPLGWMWIIIGFFLFRFFDVIKPWPIAIIDKKVKGGIGVMLDDVLAGVYALISLQVIVRIVGL